ncbi:hypothetical protein [Hyalangium sp.]|uniref:hypothetical protein n=1 Tax=Hyalangium sp. TaxID=2028555 RepID=UPI002D475B36|nr:hypothetical protein [Hyalangium sp.]HYH95070.1 hypothetical protein [Hyalangium sp.]
MDTTNSVALAQRLEAAEVAVHEAYAELDGSPKSWTVLHSAKRSYREAEAEAVVMLGAHAALDIIMSRLAPPELQLAG